MPLFIMIPRYDWNVLTKYEGIQQKSSPSRPQQNPAASSFPQFRVLPKELQMKIWTEAFFASQHCSSADNCACPLHKSFSSRGLKHVDCEPANPDFDRSWSARTESEVADRKSRLTRCGHYCQYHWKYGELVTLGDKPFQRKRDQMCLQFGKAREPQLSVLLRTCHLSRLVILERWREFLDPEMCNISRPVGRSGFVRELRGDSKRECLASYEVFCCCEPRCTS